MVSITAPLVPSDVQYYIHGEKKLELVAGQSLGIVRVRDPLFIHLIIIHEFVLPCFCLASSLASRVSWFHVSLGRTRGPNGPAFQRGAHGVSVL
jgi:hypothetical protein